MTDLMKTGRMLAEAVKERQRLLRDLTITDARINTLTAEIMSMVTDEPRFRDGPCQNQDCPNVNWPHYASDDLEIMSMVEVTSLNSAQPEYVDGLCPPASDDLDAMTPVAFNPRSSAVSIDWRDKVAFDTRSVLEDFAQGCSPSCVIHNPATD